MYQPPPLAPEAPAPFAREGTAEPEGEDGDRAALLPEALSVEEEAARRARVRP